MRQSYLQHFEDYLRAHRLKLTEQRRLIADAFFQKKGYVSAEELYRHIQENIPSIGFATVYRTLKLLAGAGLATGKNFGDGFVRFECCVRNNGHHDHLICTKCGKIIEFVNPHIEKMQEMVAREHGFRIIDHSLDIYGICQECSAK